MCWTHNDGARASVPVQDEQGVAAVGRSDLGYNSYVELRALVGDVHGKLVKSGKTSGIPHREELLKRIDEHEVFMRGEVFSHFEHEDACDAHCLRHLLSTTVNPSYACECVHERTGGGVGDPPSSAWDKYKKEGGNAKQQFQGDTRKLNGTFTSRYWCGSGAPSSLLGGGDAAAAPRRYRTPPRTDNARVEYAPSRGFACLACY